MEPLNPPSVAIDGHTVRRIREEKRLTQLYVSKVVAVTTDTVSRWENNRYPTIMRENALKLAESLEVDLEEILKKEVEDEILVIPEGNARAGHKEWFYFAAVIFSILAGFFYYLFFLQPSTVPVLNAKRILPFNAAPGSKILIQVELSAEKPQKGMILKENFPIGWHLLDSQPKVSHLDNEAGVARWIFRNPLLKTQVFYLLQVPEEVPSSSDLTFLGELIANSDGEKSSVFLQSNGSMGMMPFHWADSNGDNVIDDVEILEVSDLTDEAESLNLDWDLLEIIWEEGSYRWSDEKKQFIPVQPVSD